MEPVTFKLIIGVLSQILTARGNVIINVQEISRRWKDAPNLLQAIEQECDTILASIMIMKHWVTRHFERIIDDGLFLQQIYSAITSCLGLIQGLEKSTVKYRQIHQSRRQKFKLLFNEASLKRSLEELRWQAQATQGHWTVFHQLVKLYLDKLPSTNEKRTPSHRRKSMDQMQTRFNVHESQSITTLSSLVPLCYRKISTINNMTRLLPLLLLRLPRPR